MKKVESSAIILPQVQTLEDLERIARVCYKSEDKAIEGSAERLFTKTIIPRGHTSILEHARVIFEVHPAFYKLFKQANPKYFEYTSVDRCLISGNLRAFYEYFCSNHDNIIGELDVYSVLSKEWLLFFSQNSPNITNNPNNPNTSNTSNTFNPANSFMPGLAVVEPSKLSNKEHDIHNHATVHVTTDRGVSHQWVRHRSKSFAQESTRYCNYSKSGLSVLNIAPHLKRGTREYAIWENHMKASENAYNMLIERGVSPEIARSVLPSSTKTELIVTATYGMWKEFFKLRTASDAHPQMREVAIPLEKEMQKLEGYNE